MLARIFCEVDHIYEPWRKYILVNLCKQMRLAPAQPKPAQEKFSPPGQRRRKNAKKGRKSAAGNPETEPPAGRR